MEGLFNIGRRAFVAMGVAAAAGAAKAQSKVVKARIVKGDPDPLRDVVKPADDEHQELGHLGGRYRCVGFEDEPLQIVSSLRNAGYKSAMPVWGDRIV